MGNKKNINKTSDRVIHEVTPVTNILTAINVYPQCKNSK